MSLIEEYLPIIEKGLTEYLPSEDCAQGSVCTAMKYALLDGGKRIRPILVLEFCRVCGGNVQSALPFACAVEMIHSYSLIHDDLPCMDNDDLRRGKPSCHKQFGEAVALLAGDALLTLAFETMLNQNTNTKLSAQNCLNAAAVLAKQAGSMGMIGGQVIDLDCEGKNVPIQVLQKMDDLKTGALISAACQMGCILAGANEKMIQAADRYAKNIGLAFQIMDDILDITSTSENLGKPIGSDAENKKSTYVSLLGLESAQALVYQLTEQALAELEIFGEENQKLRELTIFLSKRTK